MKYPYILFCDFDGTITEVETLSGFLYSVSPAGADALTAEYKAGRLTLGAYVKALFGLIPSSREADIHRYIQKIGMRPGLPALLDALDGAGIPFVLLSGGLRPMVDAVLGGLTARMLDVHTALLDVSGPQMRLHSPWDDGVEVVSKPQVMAQYSYGHAVCIGDGPTDLRMARLCDTVFARDELARLLAAEGVPFYPWEDFNDVVRTLRETIL